MSSPNAGLGQASGATDCLSASLSGVEYSMPLVPDGTPIAELSVLPVMGPVGMAPDTLDATKG